MTTQELITQLWKILYKEDDSDIVVTQICELLNETEARMKEPPVMYWSEIAELTHKTQVEKFGFCTCEEQEYFPYEDCPQKGQQR
jgi:hypothetical protein